LHPQGKSAQVGTGGEIEWLVQQGYIVLAADLPGNGELGSGNFRSNPFTGGASYSEWFASILIGRSIVGVHAEDIVRLVNVLK